MAGPVTRLAATALALVVIGTPPVSPAATLDPAEVERADAGDPHYQMAVGVQLLIGADNDDERDRGRRYLEQSRAQGIASAAAALGYVYAVGHYLPRDRARAANNYEIATAQEHTAALREYGLVLMHGNGPPDDAERGLRLLERAAQLGDSAARLFVARLLDDSDEPRDAARAREWRAAVGTEQAPMVASYFALQYGLGRLVPADRGESDRWWAQVDEAASQERLADLASYYYGIVAAQRDARAALLLYERILPDAQPGTINGMAWLLCTTRDDTVRDGERAVALMETVLADNPPRAAWVDTLAACYAEAGRFDRAVETQREALGVATVDEMAAFGEELEVHLDAFEAGRPWRE